MSVYIYHIPRKGGLSSGQSYSRDDSSVVSPHGVIGNETKHRMFVVLLF